MRFALISAQGSKQGISFELSGFTESLKVVVAIIEPSGVTTVAGKQLEFELHSYFVAVRVDRVTGSKTVFNLAVRLKDSWGK